MSEEEKKKKYEDAQKILLAEMRKYQKAKDAERKKEKREQNSYRLQLASFIVAVISLIIASLSICSEKVWRWIESLRPE